MTPEHGSKSEENCNLRSAKAGHSRKEGRKIYSSLAASKADRME